MHHHLSMLHTRCTAALLAALTLCGCVSVGPKLTAPRAEAPSQWNQWHGGSTALAVHASAARRATVGERWSAFGDPVLTQLTDKARVANLDLQAAVLRFAQARASQAIVAAQRGPALGVSAAASRQRISEVGAQTRLVAGLPAASREDLIRLLSDPFTLYQAGFDASWEPDFWGRVRDSVAAAQANAAASQAMLRQARLVVETELARNYFELRSVQAQLRLLRAQEKLTEQSESLLQAQAAGGLRDASAALQRQTLLSDLRGRQAALSLHETDLMNRLTLLCGEHPGVLQHELAAADSGATPARSESQAPVDPVEALPDLAPGVPSELAEHRPDIVAAVARLQAATANTGIAVADLYPRITLGARFGYEATGGNDPGSWGSRQWSIGPSLVLPIFDAGRRRATITLRALQQQEAAIAWQQTVLQAWSEVDNALSAYAAQRLSHAQQSAKVASTEALAQIARARFARGLTSEIPSLDAEQQLLQARMELAVGTWQLRESLVAVYKALGD